VATEIQAAISHRDVGETHFGVVELRQHWIKVETLVLMVVAVVDVLTKVKVIMVVVMVALV
jgi:hypothetical protein